ncbi:MAG TPA: VWA domain-containing protein [Bacteroidetes bacterium]|nr:von Willebrand factor type A domain protein [bacterium BMS3Bbin04]HDO64594.1 VWA domain-containing protein [Bacteroidota bacterium]HEX03719.1 VWA domain-containing protein [Bacteroidota bacterium]
MIEWANPWAFAGLLAIPVMIFWYVWRLKRSTPTIVFPSTDTLKPLMGRYRPAMRHIPFVLRILAIGLLVVAVARPRAALDEQKVTSEGIDLVMALDISTSMLAEDLEPHNRLEAAKMVAKEFINGRVSDRIGLVMFAGEAFTWAPLTLDYEVLSGLMDQIEAGTVEDGTAIGKAIAVSANRLRHGEAKSKVIILLTDGVNNVDQPDPLTAAGAAAELGIKVYTIGVGTRGTARAPVRTQSGGVTYRNVEVRIDEELLEQIADLTGGQYFRATSTEALRAIYERIDQMERTEVEIEHIRNYKERFYIFAIAAFLLLLIERLLLITRLRNLALAG